MAPQKWGRRAGSHGGALTEPELLQLSRAPQAEESATSHHPSHDMASVECARGHPSGAPRVSQDDPERVRSVNRVPDHSAHPLHEGPSLYLQRDDGLQGGCTSVASLPMVQPPSGIHGPSDALAAAWVLLQFLPEVVSDVPCVNSWVAWFVDLVGFAHVHQGPAHSHDVS